MIRLPAARGAILEELVLYLLGMVGYRTVVAGEEGTRPGKSGLEVKGRGEWHQIDALAAFDRSPAFMYSLRLLVEAKCYARGRPIGIEVVRNAVGVLKDISENYFTVPPRRGSPEIQVKRFNYHAALFSTSGYTAGAQRFAVAHQIFLIQYPKVHVMESVIDGLLGLGQRHLGKAPKGMTAAGAMGRIRTEVRSLLTSAGLPLPAQGSAFSALGHAYLTQSVLEPLLSIGGSYFGMLQGRWPMHLLAQRPLPPEAFANRDEVQCRVYGLQSDRWSFAPVDAREGDPGWFRLEFDVPEEVLAMVDEVRRDRIAVAELKQEHFSILDLSGIIGGIHRQVRLRLDSDWIRAYVERRRREPTL